MKHKVLKKHLKEGNMLSIYLNWQEQQGFRGNAVLLKRLVNREPPEEDKVYLFKEIGDIIKDRLKDKINILYSYQWWRIEFIDGPNSGFVTAVKIAYYKRTFWQTEEEE